MVSKLAGIVETITSFFEQLVESSYLTLDYIFYVSLALELVLIVFFLIKSSYSYELRLDRSLDGLNRWLYYNQYLDETNLIDFNNRIKRSPKLLRYHWQQFMLYREKEPSHYMSTYNLIEKPVKTSSFSSNIKNLNSICYTLAATTFVLNLASFTGLSSANFGFALINSLLTPLSLIIFSTFFTILLRSWQNSNLAGLYQNFHLFTRYIDKSSVTLPEYIDFEVLFTKEEIKRGIPVLNEFLEKRARQEQKELEEAMRNTVEHEDYDFSHLGLNGTQILDRAMKETEIYLNQRQRTLAEIRQLESEIESIKRNYENNEKEYERKMQASKENIERLRKQQEESTNRIESNYIRKQQTDEIKKQEQLEKDYEGITLRYNQDINTLTSEIASRKAEIEEKRQLVEKAMEAEYKTFSGKVFSGLEQEAHNRQQEEKEKLLAEKENYADLLQQANLLIVERDSEIKRLNQIIEASQINRAEHGEFYNEALTKEHKQRSKKAKSQAVRAKEIFETTPNEQAEEQVMPAEIEETILTTTQDQPQYDEFGGYYDSEGYYRYQNGTYYDPQGNFHDEFGGHYDKDGNYFPPAEAKPVQTTAKQEVKVAEDQPVYDEYGGYYDAEGYYRYQNGTYYDPQGNFHDEFGGYYDKSGNYFPHAKDASVQETLVEEAPVKETPIIEEPVVEETPVVEEPVVETVAKEPENVKFEKVEILSVEEPPAPKKRGRPRKVKTEEVETKSQEPQAPKKRGRPRKVATEEVKAEQPVAPKKRGRPRKVEVEETVKEEVKPVMADIKPAEPAKKRGRTKKDEEQTEEVVSKKRAKRGRSLKKRTETSAKPAATKRGRPKKEAASVDPLKEIAQQIELENEILKQQHEELRKQIDSTLNEIDTLPNNDNKNSSNN